MRKSTLATLAATIALTACAGGVPGNVVSQQDTAAVQSFLQKAAVSTQAGLDRSYNDFAAATPQFTDGMSCVGTYPDSSKPIDNVGLTNVGTGARAVVAAVLREVNANPATSGLTPAEAIAKASIYQPGSAQFSWVIKQIETSCIAYLHDENQAISSVSGMFSSAGLLAILQGAPLAQLMRRTSAGG